MPNSILKYKAMTIKNYKIDFMYMIDLKYLYLYNTFVLDLHK